MALTGTKGMPDGRRAAYPPFDVHDLNLTRRFGELLAVDHPSAAVVKGKIFGLIGSEWCRQEHF